MVGILSSLPVTGTGSPLLGNGSLAGKSILEVGLVNGTTALFGDLGSTTSALLSQVKANANQKLVVAENEIEESNRFKKTAIDTQRDRWITVKSQVNNAQIAVSNSEDGIKKIAQILLLMRGSVAGTNTAGENPKIHRDKFNDQFNKINNEADVGGKNFNLIGNINRTNYAPNTIEYRNNDKFGFSTITGTYAGSDYRIEANDGTVWVPDIGTDLIQSFGSLGGTVQQYTTEDGIKINKGTSVRTGIELVSYNAKTNAITVKITVVPTEDPLVVTGTLKKHGNGIMPAWYYGNFETDAGRAQAFKDISAAEINLVSASAEIQKSATITGIDQRRADSALSDLTQQAVKLAGEKFDQLEDVRNKAAQQYLSMEENLKSISRQQRDYLAAFAGFIKSPFSRSILSLKA